MCFIKKILLVTIAIGVCCFTHTGYAAARNGRASSPARHQTTRAQESIFPRSTDESQIYHRRSQYAEEGQSYQARKASEKISPRQQRLRQSMRRLRKHDPETYWQLREKMYAEKKLRWERLRREDPQRFNEILRAHKKRFQARMLLLKKHDPDRYERLQKRIRELKMYQTEKTTTPEESGACFQQYPHLQRIIDRYEKPMKRKHGRMH